MIRVVVVDDHHLVRQGICSLLDEADDIEVVAEGADGQEVVALVEQHRPDVLLLDLSMARQNGIQTAEQLQRRGLETRIVMLSVHNDRHLVRQALHAGIKGYLLKTALKEELLLAVRATYAGHGYLSPEISQIVVSDFVTDATGPVKIGASPLAGLTERELQILKLVAEGHTNRGIARLLQVSTKTIQKHRANLMAKLGVHNIAGLTQLAIKHGLVNIE